MLAEYKSPQQVKRLVSNSTELRKAMEAQTGFNPTQLGRELAREGVITKEQLLKAIDLQKQTPGRKLGSILSDMGVASTEQVHLAVALSLGAPSVKLDGFDFESKALASISAELARTYNVIPLIIHNERLVLAMENLLDMEAVSAIGFIAQRMIESVYAPNHEIKQAINKHYELQEQEHELDQLQLSNFYNEDDNSLWKEAERLANEQPIVRLVNSILMDAIYQRASDVHIRPGNKQVELLYRIDGVLINKREIQKGLLPAIVSRIKILSRLNIAEHRLPQDGRSRMQDGSNIIDLRVSVIPCQYGESIVIRILNKGEGLRSLNEIGFSSKDEERFAGLINKNYGILLVTGPTGSGKTTTLYAALREVQKRNLNIVTVEDPVEYEFEGMRQIQIQPAIHFGFPQALRHILRHDPDVIMIGEIRDRETCNIAVEGALTGHLVLSTLHTNDAPGAVTRLMEMGVEPYLLKSAIVGVLAQRLVRRNCPHCLAEETIDPKIRSSLGISKTEKFYKGTGCEKCNHTGFHGRLAVYELLIVSENLRNHIESGVATGALRELAISEGMVPLTAQAIEQARQHNTSLSEVYRIGMETVFSENLV